MSAVLFFSFRYSWFSGISALDRFFFFVLKMLVITRKPGQALYLGDDIKITLQGIRGNQVRIGIDAPSNVRIYREEIYLQILDENRSAAAVAPSMGPDLGNFAAAWKSQKQQTLNELAQVSKKVRKDEDD